MKILILIIKIIAIRLRYNYQVGEGHKFINIQGVSPRFVQETQKYNIKIYFVPTNIKQNYIMYC